MRENIILTGKNSSRSSPIGLLMYTGTKSSSCKLESGDTFGLTYNSTGVAVMMGIGFTIAFSTRAEFRGILEELLLNTFDCRMGLVNEFFLDRGPTAVVDPLFMLASDALCLMMLFLYVLSFPPSLLFCLRRLDFCNDCVFCLLLGSTFSRSTLWFLLE